MGNEQSRATNGCYFFNVQTRIRDGYSVLIRGRPNASGTQFTIDLGCGPDSDHDIALRLNANFSNSRVTRNSQHNRTWGQAEHNGGFPFSKDVDFMLQINAEPTALQIMVSNRHLYTFNHRMPKELITSLRISGDTTISNVAEIHGQRHNTAEALVPLRYPHPTEVCQSDYLDPINNPTVPLSIPVPCGMMVSRIIFIIGRVNPTASRFVLSLACAPGADSDIAFQFEVRVRYEGDNNVVVRNAKQSGRWGEPERRMSYFPFFPGSDFQMMILATDVAFKVAVDNQHYIDFNHRIHPLTTASTLSIYGDVTLNQLRFQ